MESVEVKMMRRTFKKRLIDIEDLSNEYDNKESNYKDDIDEIQNSLKNYSTNLSALDIFAAGVAYARLRFKSEIFLRLISEIQAYHGQNNIDNNEKLDLIRQLMIGRIGAIKPRLRSLDKRKAIEFPKKKILEEIKKIENFQDLEKSEILAKQLHEELNKDPPSAKCELCGNEIPEQEYKLMDNCSHIFHSKCLTKNLQFQISYKKVPLMCPGQGCTKDVGVSDIRLNLDKNWIERYEKLTIDSYLSAHEESVVKCINPQCGAFMEISEGVTRIICRLCNTEWCLNCKCNYHQGMNCEQYQESQKKPEERSYLDKARKNSYEGKPKADGMKVPIARIVRDCPYCHIRLIVSKPGLINCNCGTIFCTECNLVNTNCKCWIGTKK